MSKISEETVDAIAKQSMAKSAAAHKESEPVQFTQLPPIIPQSSLSEEERQQFNARVARILHRFYELELPK